MKIQSEATFYRPVSSIPIILGILLVLLLFGFYWGVFVSLVEQLITNEDNAYGLFLPFVAAYIVYRKWPQIKSQSWQPSWWGLALIILGFAIYMVGELMADLLTSRFSFLVVISGLICLLGGWGLLRFFAFPLFLIALMFPLPLLFTRQLSIPLQFISSHLAAFSLSLFIPVSLDGNIIDLGNRSLEVSAACSGLRYLYNLLALGCIYCYFYQRRLWKIAVLLVSIFPFAIAANALRLVIIAFFPIFEKGIWHTSIGFTIFLLGFDYLNLINRILNFLQPQDYLNAHSKVKEYSKSTTNSGKIFSQPLTHYLSIAIIVVLVFGFSTKVIPKVPSVHLLQGLENFPMKLGPWHGHKVYVDPDSIKSLTADAFLNANFINPDHGQVGLWIAYYGNVEMAGGIHSPFLCLTSGGWSVKEAGKFDVLPGRPINYMLLEKPGKQELVYYWYIQNGRQLTSLYFYKFFMILNKIYSRRADAALVRLNTPVRENVKSSHERLKSFAGLLIPLLPQYIPE